MKIFLCSTYSDLVEERKSAIEAITRLQHQHGTMEFFGARADRPIETCLQEVRTSDLLVVIIGHKYGTYVGKTGISFTETEFNEGSGLGKPCLVYFRDPGVPVLPEHVERSLKKTRQLAAFKKRLRGRYTVASFRNPNDLAVQVAADIPKAMTSTGSMETLEGRVQLLKSGANAWNDWRRTNPRPTDLRGASLTGAKLHGANLSEAKLDGLDLDGSDLSAANLSRAGLRKTNLQGADLGGTTLIGADLGSANLRGANLREANLSEANLSMAYLIGADFRRADLSGATLDEATAGETNFADINLSVVRGLDTIRHEVPSTIGIDTVYKSQFRIPEVFLRGCGVADNFIALMGSLVARPIEFYSCFVSYSTQDREFAERLHADLQAIGVRCWFAPYELQAASETREKLDEAVRLHDKLVLILSESSMNSPWVKAEIANARQREEREKKQMLFPITVVPFAEIKQWKLFDADIGIDSAREIREYFIPDFSNWKDHDSYQTAFQRLVSDLKAQASD